MCLIVFANKYHDKYKLIFAANRDEFYNRPTEAAHFWKDHPELLAGKDLQAGGTWIGVTKSGKFAAITNYRDMQNTKENAPSRGKITLNFLLSDISPENYFSQIKSELKNYNGFNLILGNIDNLFYISNIKSELTKIESGIHGLSNAFLDTSWPKVKKSKLKLEDAINSRHISEEGLMKILDDKSFAEDENLPETGVGIELERVLSSAFIESDKYGTRCSTVLLVDKNNNVKFVERTFIPAESRFIRNEFNFEIEGR
jgi:uncharacterized protein with NRDE domain